MIRPWSPWDRELLVPLILEYLKEVQALYDYSPTEANATFLYGVGLTYATQGEPVLVKLYGNVPVGWTSWIPAVSHLVAFKDKVLLGMGTYVSPLFRRKGIARQLHVEAEKIARENGYTRIDRIVGGGEGERMLLRDGWKPSTVIYSKEI